MSGVIALTSAALPAITESLTISGGPAGITIDGSALTGSEVGLDTQACTAQLTLSDLTVTRFRGTGIASCGTTSLTRVTTSSTGHNGFSGIVAAGESLSLLDSVSSDNSVAGYDITANDPGSAVTISGVTAERNAIGLSGYATDGPVVTISGSRFAGNSSGGSGWYAGPSSTIAIDSSTFADNNPLAGSFNGGLLMSVDGATVTVTGSQFTGNASPSGGGIIAAVVNDGTFDIGDSTISDNRVVNGGYGVGGGLFVQALDGVNSRLSVHDSVIDDNSADNLGGAIYLQDIGVNDPTAGVRIERTTMDGNSASYAGGAIFLSGWTENATAGQPVLALLQSTLSNNSTTGTGGALVANDIGNSSPDSSILIDNSTIVGNSAQAIGGMALGGQETVFTISHSTVVGNTSTTNGAGLTAIDADVQLSHSVIADNDPVDTELIGTATLSVAWSLIATPDAASLISLGAGNGNLPIGLDPRLQPLANNGGPTLTMLPRSDSPLIDAGNPSILGAPTVDQRGLPRIVRVIDLGSVEVAATTPDALLPATGSAGSALALPLGLWLLLAGIALALGASASRRTAD